MRLYKMRRSLRKIRKTPRRSLRRSQRVRRVRKSLRRRSRTKRSYRRKSRRSPLRRRSCRVLSRKSRSTPRRTPVRKSRHPTKSTRSVRYRKSVKRSRHGHNKMMRQSMISCPMGSTQSQISDILGEKVTNHVAELFDMYAHHLIKKVMQLTGVDGGIIDPADLTCDEIYKTCKTLLSPFFTDIANISRRLNNSSYVTKLVLPYEIDNKEIIDCITNLLHHFFKLLSGDHAFDIINQLIDMV